MESNGFRAKLGQQQRTDETEEMLSTREWRRALRSQPAYRIVHKTIKGQTTFITCVSLVGLLILVYCYANRGSTMLRSSTYNYTYPLTRPIITNNLHTFKIGIIADLDTNSRSQSEKSTWFSYLKTGYLTYNPHSHRVAVTWDKVEPVRLTDQYALKGRGMELSELVVFDGRLLTFDDRTGLIYEIVDNRRVVPWLLLMDGDGRSNKGFKSEWATVKNEVLYVGSMGKEWTTATGQYENSNPQFIKTVSEGGQVTHVDWQKEYKRVRGILDIDFPGYMIHESAVYSKLHKKWFFLPRRCSKENYDEVLDERRGCSVLISADDDLYNVQKVPIYSQNASRGFSSFRFVPTSDDFVIVALRTVELNGKQETYITSFTTSGEIIMDDEFVADIKYEGLEFI